MNYDMDIDLVTSGTQISKENSQLMADALSEVCISVEGIEANYERIRGPAWDELQRKIGYLVQARNVSTKEKPLKIYLGVTVLRQCQEDAFKLIEFAKSSGLYGIHFRNFIPQNTESTEWSLLYYEAEHNDFFRRIMKFSEDCGIIVSIPPLFPENEFEKNIFGRKNCHFPFEVIGLQASGTVNTCCDDRIVLGQYEPGVDNVKSIWQSAEYVRLRQSVNSKSPLGVGKTCPLVNQNPFAYSRTFYQEPETAKA